MDEEKEYEEQIERVVSNFVQAAIGVGLAGGYVLIAGLAHSGTARELLKDGWNYFIDCVNKDY